MNENLTPPGWTERVRAERVLIAAPHYDDEVLGCGGLAAPLAASGAVVRVLFLTDGSGGQITASEHELVRTTVREFNVYRWAGRMLSDAGRWRLRERIAARVQRHQTE